MAPKKEPKKTTAVAVKVEKVAEPLGAEENFLALVERIATNPDVDVAKMEAILNMQERVLNRRAQDDFNNAMNRVQSRMPRIKKHGKAEFVDKDGVTQSRTYARYEDIDREIRNIYQAEGFACRFNSTADKDGKPVVMMKVSHSGGHTEELSLSLQVDTSGAKNNLQGMGSTISYARRYLTEMAFNIVKEGVDDDGAGADEVITTDQAAEIDNMINELADAFKYKPQFLTYMKVTSVLDIKARDRVKAVNAINAKKEAANRPPKGGAKQ